MQMAIARQSSPQDYDGFDRQPIAGEWRHGRSGSTREDRNPYNDMVLVEIPQADGSDLDDAYRAAASAQQGWAEALPSERAAVMRAAASVMEARQEEIVRWLIREAGSTRNKALMEWSAVHAVLLEAASAPYKVQGRILPGDVAGKECRVYRKPVGVVGIISPWNWPLQLTARSLFPALAVGNAAVVKPASDTPVAGGLLIAKILEEAGLPPAVLSVVVGRGSEIGDAFVCHPIPRVISFTGSTAVGRRIARLATESPMLKRVELELGGNGPFVVLNDADLDTTVEAAVFGKFLHQGQICMIANRFVIDAALHDRFVERFVERVRSLETGDPDSETAMIGPIINRKQLDSILDRIRSARKAGADQVLGGEPEGLVLPPHVLTGVANDMQIAREEIFGPVAPIIRARDEDDALRIANDTTQGLSACVFTEDLERGSRFAQRLESGMVHVNDQPVNDLPNNPFGGEKNSGIGRFGGEWAVDAFTTDQWMTVQHVPRRFPGAAPMPQQQSVGG